MVILVMREHMLTMSDIGLNGRASGLGDEGDVGDIGVVVPNW